MNEVAQKEKAKRGTDGTYTYRGVVIHKFAGKYQFRKESFYESNAIFLYYSDKNYQLKEACQQVDKFMDRGFVANKYGDLIYSPDAKENKILEQLESHTQFLRDEVNTLEQQIVAREYEEAQITLNKIVPRRQLIAKLNNLLSEIA